MSWNGLLWKRHVMINVIEFLTNVFKYSRQTQCQQIICFDFEIFIQNLVVKENDDDEELLFGSRVIK